MKYIGHEWSYCILVGIEEILFHLNNKDKTKEVLKSLVTVFKCKESSIRFKTNNVGWGQYRYFFYLANIYNKVSWNRVIGSLFFHFWNTCINLKNVIFDDQYGNLIIFKDTCKNNDKYFNFIKLKNLSNKSDQSIITIPAIEIQDKIINKEWFITSIHEPPNNKKLEYCFWCGEKTKQNNSVEINWNSCPNCII